MATYKKHELTPEEKAQIEAAHERIVKTLWRQYADAFGGDQAFFLHECAECFEQGVDAYGALISTVKLEKMQPDISVAWEALNTIRRKWNPFIEGYNPISDDEKLLKYLRSVIWRMHKKQERHGADILRDENFDGCFDSLLQTNNDLNDIELDITLRQAVKDMKPERQAEIIAVMRNNLFNDIGRDALTTALGWDRKRVDRVWKFIQRKRIREKMI